MFDQKENSVVQRKKKKIHFKQLKIGTAILIAATIVLLFEVLPFFFFLVSQCFFLNEYMHSCYVIAVCDTDLVNRVYSL